MSVVHLFHAIKYAGALAVVGGLLSVFVVCPTTCSASGDASALGTNYVCKNRLTSDRHTSLSLEDYFSWKSSTEWSQGLEVGSYGALAGCVIGVAFPKLRRMAGGEASD